MASMELEGKREEENAVAYSAGPSRWAIWVSGRMEVPSAAGAGVSSVPKAKQDSPTDPSMTAREEDTDLLSIITRAYEEGRTTHGQCRDPHMARRGGCRANPQPWVDIESCTSGIWSRPYWPACDSGRDRPSCQ